MTEPLATYTLYDGSEYSVLERPEGPEDALIMRFRLGPDCAVPPPHVHPHTTETFEVLQGEFEVLVEAQWQAVQAGASAAVEPGVRHTFRNHSGAEVVIRNVHDPHHGFEPYIRAIAELSQEFRTTDARSARAAARMAVLWGRHDDLIRPADLPLKLAFPILRAFARIARISPPD